MMDLKKRLALGNNQSTNTKHASHLLSCCIQKIELGNITTRELLEELYKVEDLLPINSISREKIIARYKAVRK